VRPAGFTHPLREVLKWMAEGLLRHEPSRRGCFVNEVTSGDLDDIFR
jgi:DNA-binding GntR family transcriptional regulator